jgi:hypothetical protein
MRRADPTHLQQDINTYMELHKQAKESVLETRIKFNDPEIYMLVMRAKQYLEHQELVLNRISEIGAKHSV